MTCTLTSTAASIVLFTACSLLFTSAFTRLAVSLALVACFICPLCCNRRCNDPLVTARTSLRTSSMRTGMSRGFVGHSLYSFGHIADRARTGFPLETSWKPLETLKPSFRANQTANLCGANLRFPC